MNARIDRLAEWLYERTLGCNPRGRPFDHHPWARASVTGREHYRDLARALVAFMAQEMADDDGA